MRGALIILIILSGCTTPHELAMQQAAQNMSFNNTIYNTMQLHFENYNEGQDNINYVLQRSYDSKSWFNVIAVTARHIASVYDINVPIGYGYYRLRTNLQAGFIDSKIYYVR